MMNDNLKNLKIEPDPQVWEGISKTMRRRIIAKKCIVATTVAIAVLGTWMLWPSAVNEDGNMDSLLQTASIDVTNDNMQSTDRQETVNNSFSAGGDCTPSMEATLEEDDFANLVPTGTPYVDRYQTPVNIEQKGKAVQVEEVEKNVASLSVTEAKTDNDLVATAETIQSLAKAKVSNSHTGIEVFIPNVFTPDGDVESNRVFKAIPSETVSNYKMIIFDRSGHKVFEGNSVAEGWDGTYNGQKLPQGAYVYVLSFTTNDGMSDKKSGSVVLVR